MIIDSTYFILELKHPNANTDTQAASQWRTNAITELDSFIKKYSSLFLKITLGYNMYKVLVSNLDTNGLISDNAPQNLLELVKGKTYTKEGKTYRWEGLAFEEFGVKTSLLANYVFCKVLKNEQGFLSDIGNVKLEGKNSVRYTPRQEYTEAWNEFVRLNEESCGDFVSLIQFLEDHKEDFPESNPKKYKSINLFGI